MRIAVGPRDVTNNTVELFRRDTGTKESINGDEIASKTSTILHDMQHVLFNKTKTMREQNTVEVNTYDKFKKALDDGKFVLAHWD